MDRWITPGRFSVATRILPLVFMAPSLHAQPEIDLFDLPLEQLEQIVVTAQKREQFLQDVPIAISTVSGEKISDGAIRDLQALSVHLPGIAINQAVIDNNLFIRGIGSGVNLGFERSVGTYVDGVYIGRGQLARTPFLDVERVEVLKGPQGILFGKNTIAGALNITTKDPTSEFSGLIEGYVDPRYGEELISTAVSGSLSESVSGRMAVSYRHLDGYYEHLLTGDDLLEREDRVLRGKLRWQPDEALSATLKLEYASFDDNGRARTISAAGAGSQFGYLVSDTRPVSGFRPGGFEYNDTRSDTAVLTVDYTLGRHTLTSITAYLDYSADILDEVLVTPYFLVPGDGAMFTLTTDENFDQVSQEIRLSSLEDQRVSYLVGLYAQYTDLEVNRAVVWPVGGNFTRRSKQEGTSFSLFGQWTWHLSERLRLNLGARLTWEDKDFDRAQVDASPLPDTVSGSIAPFRIDRSEFAPTGSASLQYDFSDEMMGYVSLATGFKSGGFDESVTRALAPGERPEDLFEFGDETVVAVEAGAKLLFGSGTAELNLAVFRSEYDDLQSSVFDGVAGFEVDNAGSSITQGLEADLRWRARPRLLLSASMAYLDAFYDDFADGPCSQWHAQNTASCVGETRDLGGEPLVFAPDLSARLGLEYFWPVGAGLDALIDLEVVYSEGFYTASDLDPMTRQDAYTLVNLRLALNSVTERWEAALVGRNLTDEKYSSWQNDLTFSETPGRQNTYSKILQAPRTIAVQGRVRF